MDQNSKLEQLRALLATLSSCCADKATETKLEDCRLLLNDILDAIPGAGSGNYALETSMQSAITKLQSILDRIESIEADLGYDSLLDPLDTQKKSLDDIQATLQSLYDDCCPNDVLGDIAADTAAIEQDTAAIEQDTAAIQGDTANIAGKLNNMDIRLSNIETNARLTEEHTDALLDCCDDNYTLLSQIESYSAQTYDVLQARLPTDLATRLANIEAALAAIQTCVCSGSGGGGGGGGCTPCPDEESEFSDKDPEYEGDGEETGDPPDDYTSWEQRNQSICRRANWLLEQMIKDAGSAANLIASVGAIGDIIMGTVIKGKAVSGLANEGAITLAKKGLTAKGWIPIATYASLITTVTGWIWSVIKSDIEYARCQLVNVIYQNRKNGSAWCHTKWDEKVDELFELYSATNWALKLWMWDTSFEVIYQPEMWASEAAAGDPNGIPLTMEPCLCFDVNEMFNPGYWYVTNPTDYIEWDTTYVTKWNNKGSIAGQYFQSPSAGLRPTWEDGGMRFQSGRSMRSYNPTGGGKIYVVCVVFKHTSSGYILGRFNSGTDSWHYRPSISTNPNHRVSYVSGNGGVTGNCGPGFQAGKNLLIAYYVTAEDKTHVRLNGQEICTVARGTGADFINASAFFYFGGHPDYPSATFNGIIYEVAMYEEERTLDQILVIESTMANNNEMAT